MAASTTAFAAVGSVVSISITLTSTNSFGSTSALKLTPVPAATAHRLVAARASVPEKEQQQESITRRDILANLLGAGAAMGFVGRALAANPGTLPRSLNVKKKEEKPEGKKE